MGQTDVFGSPPDVSHVRKHDVESWHSTICDVFCHSDYIPGRETRFSGELSFTPRGGARMARIRSSSGRFQRDRQAVKRDSCDGFVMLVSLRGELHIVQNGRPLQARCGEALLYRHGAPFEIEFPRSYAAASLWVDPDLMVRHCPAIVAQGAGVIRPETTNATLALAMVRELCVNSIAKGTTDAARLVGATLDVVSTLGMRAEGADALRNGWLFDKLADHVLRDIDNTELNLDSLVAATGVSARTLNRLFADRGTTPMRWVWERRLEIGRDLLAGGRVRSVTEAAFSVGFKDSAHFSRAFSRRFGRPPITVLRRS